MKTVAIVGVGLIGGSFALALRKAGFTGEIFGVSSPRSIRDAIECGAISAGVDLGEATKCADLIYLSQPIEQILDTLPLLARHLRTDCLVTDAGSTKELIVRQAAHAGIASQFVGGHPLAGKEQRGVRAADANLFQGRPYVLTPSGTERRIEQELKNWLSRIGAVLIEMTPSEHDATVAATSHLPQLVATALAAVLSSSDNPFVGTVFGPGLMDMTRLALSSPEVWMSVLKTNRTAIEAELQKFKKYLTSLEAILDNDLEIIKTFHLAAEYAGRIRK